MAGKKQPPNPGHMVLVECEGARHLAARDASGKWRSLSGQKQLSGEVKVVKVLPYPEPSESEDTLRAKILRIERKLFTLALGENPQGRFLRIAEHIGGRHDHVIVPDAGLDEFRRVFDEMTKAAREIPQGKLQNPE